MMKPFNITPYQRLILYKYFGYYLQGTIAKYFHFQSFLMFFIKIIFLKKNRNLGIFNKHY